MSNRKNVVASVLARLRNSSKSSGVLFQQILQQYAMERFLYRISKSKHAQGVAARTRSYPATFTACDRSEPLSRSSATSTIMSS